MSEVKRYEATAEWGNPVMSEYSFGEWVEYEDYAALKAECESNAKSAQYSAESNRRIARKNGAMHDEILSLKAERDMYRNAEMSWEKAMMSAIGEDGTGSVIKAISDLKAEREALAAEATYLREEIRQHSESTHFCEVCGKDDPCKNDDVCWAISYPFPATDAYANQLRAGGVEMFADNQMRVAERHDADNRPVWADERRLSAEQARAFAANLRKENGNG